MRTPDHQQISDDLLLYALRELPGAQATQVREHLDDCPQCRRELAEINSDMAALALSTVGPTPPQRSRERLLKAIRSEPRSSQLVMRRPWWSFAPLFAMLFLAAFGLLLWRDNVSLRQKLEATQAESQRQARDLAQGTLVLQTLTSPRSSHYELVTGSDSPEAPIGHASYLRDRGAVVFTASHCHPLPNQKTYQLWLIPMDGSAPVPAGTFRPNPKGDASLVTPQVKKKVPAKMFAVTVEPDGGSETPTMPIMMAGE